MTEEQDNPLEGELVPKGIPATEVDLVKAQVDQSKQGMRLTVVDDKGLEEAGEILQTGKAGDKTLESNRKEHLKPILEIQRAINKFYKTASEPWAKAERHLKSQISGYQFKVQQEKEREAKAEAARIAKNAEKRAERIEKKAASFDDEDAAAEAAAEAENIRMQAELEAEHAAAAIVTQEKPRARGVSTQKKWVIEVTDKAAFVGAVAAGNDARLTMDMVKVNDPVLNKLATALKGGCKGIPGTRVFYTDVLSVRSAK